MQEAGALAAALPEWRHIECLVVRDFYHRYTVDEHTLVAIASLESVTDGRFAGLLEEIEDRALVRFALADARYREGLRARTRVRIADASRAGCWSAWARPKRIAPPSNFW